MNKLRNLQPGGAKTWLIWKDLAARRKKFLHIVYEAFTDYIYTQMPILCMYIIYIHIWIYLTICLTQTNNTSPCLEEKLNIYNLFMPHYLCLYYVCVYIYMYYVCIYMYYVCVYIYMYYLAKEREGFSQVA